VTPIRAATLTIVGLCATAWAGVVGVAGLWVMFELAPAAGSLCIPLRFAGLAILAVAQFVFMVAVSDRLFPSVGRRIGVWLAEMGMFGIVLLGIAAAVLLWLWGAFP
jgi:hypothetical protein